MEQTHKRGSCFKIQSKLIEASDAMYDEKETANIQKQILNNGLLFNIIRKNKPSEEKCKKIAKYLEAGANINTTDANDKCNTPLHIAVLNEDLKVVTFLLDRGANISSKNADNHTALDVARLLKGSESEKIINLLRNIAEDKEGDSSDDVHSKVYEKSTAIRQPERLVNEIDHNKPNRRYQFQKRKGISGLNGYLYETKLLCLILLRALHDDDIVEFCLGTNISGLGAFDDLVFKYKTKQLERPRITFLQAKHRDDPNKDKVSIGDILKDDGDFSLHKYLKSYIEVIQKFHSDRQNEIFGSPLVDTDCEFIIFTAAMENFCDRATTLVTNQKSYVTTSENGKILQFQAKEEEVECLIQTVVKLRAVQLAKRLSAFVFKKSCLNMMTDELIRVYHVFLAQNVISVTQNNEPNSSYNIGVFKETFLETNDSVLLVMKHTICKEIEILRKTTLTDETAALKSINFKLPKNFGNVTFHINGNENKKIKRLNYLRRKIQEVLQNASKKDSYFVFEITENDIGVGKILQNTDMESYRFGGLVGNLLVYDQETKMLKFNENEHHMTADSLKLLRELKTDYNLNQYRLHVKIKYFPKLSLIQEEDDRKLVENFLGKLKFYTNQPAEDHVENIIKDEIYDNLKLNIDDSFSRVKCEAIFLKVHDKIVKWWKQSKWTPYLTKTCKFYSEAKCDALYKPLLGILNYNCYKTIQNLGAKFKPYAIKALNVTDFIKNDSKLMVIVSPEINLTSIKVIQYFQENDCRFSFLKLESMITDNYLETIERELIDAYFSVLVLINAIGENGFDVTFDVVRSAFQGKIILITDADYAVDNSESGTKDFIQVYDNNNKFGDLEDDVQRMITEERELIFQGERIFIGDILNYDFLQTVKPKTIYQLIKRKTILMGKTLKDAVYDKTIDFYVNQEVSRVITLDVQHLHNYCDLHYIIEGVPEDLSPQKNYDIVLITDRMQTFDDICNKYKHSNVHMFSRDNNGDYIVWVKSKGNLNALLQYVDYGVNITTNILPRKITDVSENIVIINGEPGLGKSTLLSHLAVHTKEEYPKLWVLKINFLEHIERFSKWKRDKTHVDLIEALVFVYGAIGLQALEDDEQAMRNTLHTIGKRITINDVNEITIHDVDETADLIEIDLFNHCYNNNQVALLFDGFDEICPDYANEALQLLSTLKTSRVAFLWVTTRPYVADQLQCALGTFAHKLHILSLLGRLICLENIWYKELDLDRRTLTLHVSSFFHLICTVLGATNSLTFTGVPLHIFMIAESLLEIFKNFVEITKMFFYKFSDGSLPFDGYIYDFFIRNEILNFMNLCRLYETFINIKFYKVRFGSKKAFVSFKDPDLRRMVDQERKAFLDGHKQLSAYTLFKRSPMMFSAEEMQNISNLVEAVRSGEEKSGIIDSIVGEEPKFVHLTFMEYFAAEFFIDRLKSSQYSSILLKYLIDDILLANQSGVRRFLNSKLCERDVLFDTAFYQNNSETVVDILLSQSCLPLTTFNVVCREELDNVLYFLLKCSRAALNKYNLRNFIELFHNKYQQKCGFCTMSVKLTESFDYLISIVREIDDSKFPNLCNCAN